MAVYKSNTPTKDGRKYFFRIKYKDIFGEWHDYNSQKYKTMKEAKDEEAKYRIKVAEQKAYTSSITIKQAFNNYINDKRKRVKEQTIPKIENLFRYLKSIEDIKINDFNIVKYKKFLFYVEQQKFSIDHKNRILHLLKSIISYSAKLYNTSDSINKYIEPLRETNKIKKEMDYFTYEEYLEFDKVIDNFEYHTFFEVLYFLGLRRGEAMALTWKDINFEKNSININKTLTTKIKNKDYIISAPKTINSNRKLPLTNKLQKDLKIMYNNAIEYSDFKNTWFIFGNTEPFKETNIERNKNKYCKMTKSKKRIRVHDFRHSCASLLINKGANITLVSKYLGHSNIATTLNTYTHMYKSELEKMTDVLNKL